MYLEQKGNLLDYYQTHFWYINVILLYLKLFRNPNFIEYSNILTVS